MNILGDIVALRTRLEAAWSKETSATPARWQPERPSQGQCAVTALVVQDHLGGELLRCDTPYGSHYWNRLPNGDEVDLTRDQFEGVFDLFKGEPRAREYVLSYPATAERYMKLLEGLASA